MQKGTLLLLLTFILLVLSSGCSLDQKVQGGEVRLEEAPNPPGPGAVVKPPLITVEHSAKALRRALEVERSKIIFTNKLLDIHISKVSCFTKGDKSHEIAGEEYSPALARGFMAEFILPEGDYLFSFYGGAPGESRHLMTGEYRVENRTLPVDIKDLKNSLPEPTTGSKALWDLELINNRTNGIIRYGYCEVGKLEPLVIYKTIKAGASTVLRLDRGKRYIIAYKGEEFKPAEVGTAILQRTYLTTVAINESPEPHYENPSIITFVNKTGKDIHKITYGAYAAEGYFIDNWFKTLPVSIPAGSSYRLFSNNHFTDIYTLFFSHKSAGGGEEVVSTQADFKLGGIKEVELLPFSGEQPDISGRMPVILLNKSGKPLHSLVYSKNGGSEIIEQFTSPLLPGGLYRLRLFPGDNYNLQFLERTASGEESALSALQGVNINTPLKQYEIGPPHKLIPKPEEVNITFINRTGREISSLEARMIKPKLGHFVRKELNIPMAVGERLTFKVSKGSYEWSFRGDYYGFNSQDISLIEELPCDKDRIVTLVYNNVASGSSYPGQEVANPIFINNTGRKIDKIEYKRLPGSSWYSSKTFMDPVEPGSMFSVKLEPGSYRLKFIEKREVRSSGSSYQREVTVAYLDEINISGEPKINLTYNSGGNQANQGKYAVTFVNRSGHTLESFDYWSANSSGYGESFETPLAPGAEFSYMLDQGDYSFIFKGRYGTEYGSIEKLVVNGVTTGEIIAYYEQAKLYEQEKHRLSLLNMTGKRLKMVQVSDAINPSKSHFREFSPAIEPGARFDLKLASRTYNLSFRESYSNNYYDNVAELDNLIINGVLSLKLALCEIFSNDSKSGKYRLTIENRTGKRVQGVNFWDLNSSTAPRRYKSIDAIVEPGAYFELWLSPGRYRLGFDEYGKANNWEPAGLIEEIAVDKDIAIVKLAPYRASFQNNLSYERQYSYTFHNSYQAFDRIEYKRSALSRWTVIDMSTLQGMSGGFLVESLPFFFRPSLYLDGPYDFRFRVKGSAELLTFEKLGTGPAGVTYRIKKGGLTDRP